MRFNLKTIGLALAGLFGVLVLAIVLFIAFFPKELAAREAERRIEAATGRDLNLGGEIDVSFWPALGFSVTEASLSNPEGFGDDERFIAADKIVFAVAVMPLLRGEIEVRRLIFEGAEVRLQARQNGENNWTFPTEESGDDEQMTIEDLRLDDVRLTDALLTFQGGEGGPPLTFEDVDATLAMDSLDTPATLNAQFDYRDERLTLESTIGLPRAVMLQQETPLEARVRSRQIEASFNGAFNAQNGGLAGAIQASGTSLRRLLAWIGTPMAQGGGFGAFRLNAQMAHLGDTTALSDASIRLDDVEANGALNLITQQNDRLRVTGALSIASLDLNPYLPAPAQGGEGMDVDQGWSNDPIDLSGLRALDANLDLTLGALQFQRMSFANAALSLRVSNGAADARLSRVSLYGGGGTARLIADGSGATPRIAIELDAQNVQAEPLLRDAIGFDKITGRGQLVASLVGHGQSQASIMRSLQGAASFNFNDGQWKGVNLAQVARTIQAALAGEAVGGGAATDFAELSAAFQVNDGVAITDNVRLLNPFVRLEGEGLIDIGAQSLDMRVAPRAVRSIEGQGGDAATQGLGIPFRASGRWSNVSFRPALGDVVQNELRSRARDILADQEPGSPLAILSETLFGRQAQTETPAQTPTAGEAAPEQNAEAPAAEQPAQQQQTPAERARGVFEGILRQATQGNDEIEETTPDE